MGSDFGLQCRALQRALSIVAAVTLSNLLGHKQLHVERAQPPQGEFACMVVNPQHEQWFGDGSLHFLWPFLSLGLFVGYPGTRSQYASQSLKRRASVTEVSPAELESSIRRGGAVVLDVYAVWSPGSTFAIVIPCHSCGQCHDQQVSEFHLFCWRCGPCKLLEPALNILADKLESDVEKEGSPSPQVLRMDSDRHSAKAGFVERPLAESTCKLAAVSHCHVYMQYI